MGTHTVLYHWDGSPRFQDWMKTIDTQETKRLGSFIALFGHLDGDQDAW
jgi:hypothetical protein